MLMILAFIGVVLIDRLVKIWAMGARPENIRFLPGVLQLFYVENTGMAFGLFAGQPIWFAVIAIPALLAAFFVLRRFRLNAFCRVALGLLAGGAVGNLIDRLFLGYVVDMFDFLFVNFAVFNVADIGLTVGTIMLMFAILFMPKAWEVKASCR
jgi:lipoprotein signal peptidase